MQVPLGLKNCGEVGYKMSVVAKWLCDGIHEKS
jgi:hypothetical protein